MNAYALPSRKIHRVFEWDKKFVQRERRAYPAEDKKLTPDVNQSIVDAFLNQLSSRLDPPQFSYTALRRFLETADDRDLTSSPSTRYEVPLVLLDDRKDVTGWADASGDQHSARNWDVYARYPPKGENVSITLMHAQDLYQKQLQSVHLGLS